MNKIVASFLVFNFYVMLAKEKEYCGLFEKHSEVRPFFSQLSGSDKGAQYFGSLSDEKYPKLSVQGHVNYVLMRCACKLGYSADFVDKVDGKVIFYVCSRNKSDVVDGIDTMKAIRVQDLKKRGENLKKGDIICFPPASLYDSVPKISPKLGESMALPFSDDFQKYIFITCIHLTTSDIDTAEFFYKTQQKVDQAEYGVHIIGGELIKITAFSKGSNITYFDIFPTEQEIAKARSEFSK